MKDSKAQIKAMSRGLWLRRDPVVPVVGCEGDLEAVSWRMWTVLMLSFPPLMDSPSSLSL